MNSQYSFLKNLFLSFLIVNFYFVVFFKADREILKNTPFDPIKSPKKRFKKLPLAICVSSFNLF
ncbi:hypothetical protein FIM86_00525 [Helicobacter pylori]|nr:hypothetical protein FIM86_00525 [Helicobacter pylori]TPH87984.1 hypothetical protein FIM48_02415 [Helicobacter pylori]TPH93436.1 hypothetical protein FIM45_06390 [Helicobacter pylori]